VIFRYYNACPPPDTDSRSDKARGRLFASAFKDIEGVQIQELNEAHSPDQFYEFMETCSTESLVLFCHLSQCENAPSKLRDSSTSGVLKNSCVIVFYSGPGFTNGEAERTLQDARSAGMEGRVFVHRSPFGGSLEADNEAVAGIRSFVRTLMNASDSTLQGVTFRSDQFGWPGIAENCHLEYILSLLYDLLPCTYEQDASIDYRRLDRFRTQITGLVDLVKEEDARKRLTNAWLECRQVLEDLERDDEFEGLRLADGHEIPPGRLGRLAHLRNLLLGSGLPQWDEEHPSLVQLFSSAWGDGVP
jgi:hypothetical protein